MTSPVTSRYQGLCPPHPHAREKDPGNEIVNYNFDIVSIIVMFQ